MLKWICLLKSFISYILLLANSLKISFCFACVTDSFSLIAFICFSNTLPSGEYVNLACYIILLWSDGNISSPVRYSDFSILLEVKVDVFAASVHTVF